MKNNLKVMNKKAAMEMSVGTIVTIVLLMTVLILGLVLVRSIFSSSTSAIDSIDSSVQNEIQKLFAEEGKLIVIYPTSRQITLKKGKDPSGFAFSIRNPDEGKDFTYSIQADPAYDYTRCGTSFNMEKANKFLLVPSGSFFVKTGSNLDLPGLVLFEIPDTAPLCTIPYTLKIDDGAHASASVFVTIK